MWRRRNGAPSSRTSAAFTAGIWIFRFGCDDRLLQHVQCQEDERRAGAERASELLITGDRSDPQVDLVYPLDGVRREARIQHLGIGAPERLGHARSEER